MYRRRIRVQFMLLAMCLAIFLPLVKGDIEKINISCKSTLEKEWMNDVKHCLDSTNKLNCLKKLVDIQEKVLFKRKLRKDAACDGHTQGLSVTENIKQVLSHLNKHKEDFSRRLALQISEFLRQNEVSIDVGSKLKIKFLSSGNETVDMTVKVNNDTEVSERKMKMNTSNILALLFTPAMFIAGMMPWILPGVKMAVMMVTMMNNMAFSSALFALIRGYIFDTRPDDHILYINNGYKNHHQPVHQQHHKIYHMRPGR